MGRLGKIASVMLVVGISGVLFVMQTGIGQSFRTPKMHTPPLWEEGLLGFGSMLLFSAARCSISSLRYAIKHAAKSEIAILSRGKFHLYLWLQVLAAAKHVGANC